MQFVCFILSDLLLYAIVCPPPPKFVPVPLAIVTAAAAAAAAGSLARACVC